MSVYIWGSTWLLCVSKPLGDHTQSSIYKYSGSPGGSLHFIRHTYRTHPTSTQSIATREKHTFPHGLPSVAPKTNLNSCLYSRLLSPLELHRIKSCLLLHRQGFRKMCQNRQSGLSCCCWSLRRDDTVCLQLMWLWTHQLSGQEKDSMIAVPWLRLAFFKCSNLCSLSVVFNAFWP